MAVSLMKIYNSDTTANELLTITVLSLILI